MDKSQEKIYAKLVAEYNDKAFMYIEYPHKSFWRKNFNENDFKRGLDALTGENKGDPLLLYVHLPFCPDKCFYCACHATVSNDHKKIKQYLGFLHKEIDLFQNFFDQRGIIPNFTEIHLGGGSPTHLNMEEFDGLVKKIQSFVDIKNIREFSIEIDPRYTDKEKMLYYRSKGINRISLGIQDFDEKVQRAINRIQSFERVENLMTQDIRNLFKNGFNFDVICGLPHQTQESIRTTFERIARISPNRVCFNHLDYIPEIFKHQRLMVEGKNGGVIPDNYEKKILFRTGLEVLLKNDYIRTGYDHFAKQEDDVARALFEGKMKWNALGVTAGRYSHVIGLGPNSASSVGNYYSQNVYGVENYQELIGKGVIPSFRGYNLDKDDIIRRDVIQTIRNFSSLNYEKIEKEYNINFKRYFDREVSNFGKFTKDGLLIESSTGIQVTELGKDFVLFICRDFDNYFNKNKGL